MRAKTELFLDMLLWTAESLASPTWRNATGSFEGWAYRNGFLQEIHRLEAQALLEQRKGGMDRRLVRLTEEGRLKALGGRDPVAHWNRDWDGKWRMLMFDLPKEEEALRTRLLRFRRENGFGLLQRSVWLTPHDLSDLRKIMPRDDQVKTFVCIEGRPCGGESDASLVQGAWDWSEINALYKAHKNVLKSFPKAEGDSGNDRGFLERLLQWAKMEAQAWKEAVTMDPLLPEVLHPAGYLGKSAWKLRTKTLQRAGKTIEAIDPCARRRESGVKGAV